MSPDTQFEIAARIDHLSDGVGCFDPMQVLLRMRVAFPELVVESRDYLWEAYERIREITSDGTEAALRVAARDMQERGPKFLFQIPLSRDRSVSGTVERYWVSVASTQDFPADFRHRFTAFLHSLTLQRIQIA